MIRNKVKIGSLQSEGVQNTESVIINIYDATNDITEHDIALSNYRQLKNKFKEVPQPERDPERLSEIDKEALTFIGQVMVIALFFLAVGTLCYQILMHMGNSSGEM